MRLGVLVVATLACALIQSIGAAQDKPPKKPAKTPVAEDPPTAFRIVELGDEKSLKWSEVQTPDVKIPLSIVNYGEKPVSATITATS